MMKITPKYASDNPDKIKDVINSKNYKNDRMQGAQYFSFLDATQGFHHVKLSEQMSLLTTVHTPVQVKSSIEKWWNVWLI